MAQCTVVNKTYRVGQDGVLLHTEIILCSTELLCHLQVLHSSLSDMLIITMNFMQCSSKQDAVLSSAVAFIYAT